MVYKITTVVECIEIYSISLGPSDMLEPPGLDRFILTVPTDFLRQTGFSALTRFNVLVNHYKKFQ